MADKPIYLVDGIPIERELVVASAGPGDSGKAIALDAAGLIDATMLPVGNITGPSTSTDENVPVFDGATGDAIKDSGVGIADVARRDVANTFTDTITLSKNQNATTEFSVTNSDTGNESRSQVAAVAGPVRTIFGSQVQFTRGVIGTSTSHSVRIITNNQTRANFREAGQITLGGFSDFAQDVTVDGTFRVTGITTMDADVSVTGAATTTLDSTFNGVRVGRGAGGIDSNVAVGPNAINSNTTGLGNTGVGRRAIESTTTGGSNTAVGSDALRFNTTGNNNVGVGASSMRDNTIGVNNVGVGVNALMSNTEGGSNLGFGTFALQSTTTGSNNAALGTSALTTNTTGGGNLALGVLSLAGNTTGGNNVGVGTNSGRFIAGGDGNATSQLSIFIGRDTRPSGAGQTNQTVIGDGAIGNGSNTVTIGNSSIVSNHFTGRLITTTSIKKGSFTVATAPSASVAGAGAQIHVTDGNEGARCVAESDGADWKVIALGATISAT